MKKTKEKKGALGFLYENAFGRVILKLLTARWVSKLAGAYLNSRLSKCHINKFVKSNGIDLNDYYSDDFRCFNDCFTRKIKPHLRPIDTDASHLISPCDGLLSAYPITDDTVLPIKQSEYTVSSLLAGDKEWERYRNGICLVFRLCVDHYHRYAYLDNGKKGKNTFVRGKLHTVRPIALENRPVFAQNCREYTFLDTENFGRICQIEVGAMLVGKIANLHEEHEFKRGEEKGMFLYGGSTVVILLEKGKAEVFKEFFDATCDYKETPVKMGQCIGNKING